MPFKNGKFDNPAMGASKPIKPAGEAPVAPPVAGAVEPPHGGPAEQHITASQPGKTEGHPATGVHAITVLHTPGGGYEAMVHREGGEVESQQLGTRDELMASMDAEFPPDGAEGAPPMDPMADMDMGDSLGGVGGNPNPIG